VSRRRRRRRSDAGELAKLAGEPAAGAEEPEPECDGRASEHASCLDGAEPIPGGEHERLAIRVGETAKRIQNRRRVVERLPCRDRLLRETGGEIALPAIAAAPVRQDLAGDPKEPAAGRPANLGPPAPRDLERLGDDVVRERGVGAPEAVGAHRVSMRFVEPFEPGVLLTFGHVT